MFATTCQDRRQVRLENHREERQEEREKEGRERDRVKRERKREEEERRERGEAEIIPVKLSGLQYESIHVSHHLIQVFLQCLCRLL
jgi:hypothetical protein